jgi:hypothetical protein
VDEKEALVQRVQQPIVGLQIAAHRLHVHRVSFQRCVVTSTGTQTFCFDADSKEPGWKTLPLVISLKRVATWDAFPVKTSRLQSQRETSGRVPAAAAVQYTIRQALETTLLDLSGPYLARTNTSAHVTASALKAVAHQAAPNRTLLRFTAIVTSSRFASSCAIKCA